jgi:hypothetical protein
MKTATLADLVVSAQLAANEAASASDALARQSLKLAKFEEAGFDRADFPTWENSFNAQIEMHQAFGTQDSPATKAAKIAAAAAKSV